MEQELERGVSFLTIWLMRAHTVSRILMVLQGKDGRCGVSGRALLCIWGRGRILTLPWFLSTEVSTVHWEFWSRAGRFRDRGAPLYTRPLPVCVILFRYISLAWGRGGDFGQKDMAWLALGWKDWALPSEDIPYIDWGCLTTIHLIRIFS